MIKPVNGHILVEPLTHDEFILSDKKTYEQIGTVIDAADDLENEDRAMPVKHGDKVYFDSWLIKRYPNPNDKEKDVWLVKWEDVSGIEYAGREN